MDGIVMINLLHDFCLRFLILKLLYDYSEKLVNGSVHWNKYKYPWENA